MLARNLMCHPSERSLVPGDELAGRDAAGSDPHSPGAGHRPGAWNWAGAVLVYCMMGCAITSFIPPTYFAGISTTRHIVGTARPATLARIGP
jgi:hypothetical protein